MVSSKGGSSHKIAYVKYCYVPEMTSVKSNEFELKIVLYATWYTWMVRLELWSPVA